MSTFIKSKAEYEAFCVVANELVVINPEPEDDSLEGKALEFLGDMIEEYEAAHPDIPKWLEE